MDVQKFSWKNIRAAAEIAGVDPKELREFLSRQSKRQLPNHLLDRKLWVNLVRDYMLARDPEYNAEQMAEEIYDKFVSPDLEN